MITEWIKKFVTQYRKEQLERKLTQRGICLKHGCKKSKRFMPGITEVEWILMCDECEEEREQVERDIKQRYEDETQELWIRYRGL